MAHVTTATKPVYEMIRREEVTNVTLTMDRAEADKLLDNLREYWYDLGYDWDGPIMTQLARALGRSRTIDF